MLQCRVVGRVQVAVGYMADIADRLRRAGGRAAGMAVADERTVRGGEAALDRDRAIVREGVARTDRQGRARRDDERLAFVQRCIAKQFRIADDRAGISVEEHAVGDVAADGILVVRLDPGVSYSGRTIRSDGIVAFSFADLHSAVLNRNIPTREDSCISGGGCLDLTAVFNGNTTIAKQRRVVAGSIHFCAIRDFQFSACVNAIAVFTLCFDVAAGNFEISTHTKRHVIPGRLDGSIFCHADIRFGKQTITCIFAGRRPTLHFQIAVAAHCQVCAIINFQSAHRIRRLRFRFRMQTAQLGVVHHRYLVGGVARLHTDLQRRMISTGCIRHICIAIQHTNAVPLARTIGRAIYDNLRIRNVQCAGQKACRLRHAKIGRTQRTGTVNLQILCIHLCNCVVRSFWYFKHQFHIVITVNATVHNHIVCTDIGGFASVIFAVSAPDNNFLIRRPGKFIDYIPREKFNRIRFYFIIGASVCVTPPPRRF